jgi:RNA polymerase sigma-70 factor (ECF subfamily)
VEKDNLFNDQELFKRISGGDTAAFSNIFQTYADPLYWHAVKLLKSEFWAEEIVQEVFVQLWAKRDLLAAINAPSAYLYKMLGNKAMDRLRRDQLEIKMQYLVAQALHLSQTNETMQGDRWDRMQALLHAAVNNLPEQRKRVYQLKYRDGYSYEEIAAILSISVHTVRNQMSKALPAIRTFLIEKGADLFLLLIWIAALQ